MARFLQADPFIEDTSTLNRYTYVHNNPLAYTDPSGYFSVGQFLRTVVAVAIAVYTGIHVAALLKQKLVAQAFLTAVAGGAASGAVSSGTVEGAAWGAFSAAVFFGIGQAIAGDASLWTEAAGVKKLTAGGLAVKTVTHGLAGGTLARLQGGKFGHGFVAAAGSAATAPMIDSAAGGNDWAGAAVSSVIGGTLSKLSGGKFGNGAVTAAMAYAFNQMATKTGGPDPAAPDGGDMEYPRFIVPSKYRDDLSVDDIRAAYDFLYALNADSHYFDIEYGAIFSTDGTIHMGIPIGNGKVGFTHGGVTFVRDGGGYLNLSLIGIEPRFMAHTHGGAGRNRDLFSPPDITIAKAGKMPVFMSDYQGSFKVFMPHMDQKYFGGITLCRSCIPTARR